MMKIDLTKIDEADLTIEEALVLVFIEMTRKEEKYPSKVIPEASLYPILVEKGILYVTTTGFGITTTGYQTFREITIQPLLNLKKDTVKLATGFNEFWTTFPSGNEHGRWIRTRLLRSNKATTKRLYEIAILNGTKHEDIIKALTIQIKQAKATSITENKLTYIKNSTTWLRQKEYEIILESIVDDDNTEEDWTTNMI